MILGVIFGAIVLAGSFVMQKCPAGYLPEGFVPPVPANAKKVEDKTPLQMLKMPIFYVMLIMLTCGGTFGLMIISNAKGLALNMAGVSMSTATLFVSVLCLFNTAGRLVAGTLSDKLGRINTLTAAMTMALVGLGILYICGMTASVVLLAIGLMVIGVCFGTFMGVFPGFCTDQFGTKYNTVNYGIMWIGFSLAGIVGPMVLSTIYANVGSYQGAFLIAIGIAVVGLICSILYRKIVKK